MASPQSSYTDSGSSQLKDFAVCSKLLLNDAERQYMYAILREYRMYKRLDALVLCLRSVLDTPVKMDLLKDVRQFVDPSQLHKYDRLVPYHKMAHPWSKKAFEELELDSRRLLRASESDLTRAAEQQRLSTSSQEALMVRKFRTPSAVSILLPPRIIQLHRKRPGQPLNFYIRGGSEKGRGIFISNIPKGSAADLAGLKVGDQILEANGVTFDSIDIRSAAAVLVEAPKITMLIQPAEKVSAIQPSNEKILWYDVEQKCVVEDGFVEHNFLKLFKANSHVYRKVSIHVRPGRQFLGFNIRGGSDYDLGIYVSRVDPSGLGERKGVRVGDRLMVVNGVSFNNIRHSAAVKLLRTHKQLLLILLFVGFYPVCKVFEDLKEDELFSISSEAAGRHDGLNHPELSKSLIHGERLKFRSRFLEDTRIDSVWKSLSDGELQNEEPDGSEDGSVESLPLHRREEVTKPSSALALRKQDQSHQQKNKDVFMRRKETASLTPSRIEKAHEWHRTEEWREFFLSDDEELNLALPVDKKPMKPRRKMRKSKSLKDLSGGRFLPDDNSHLNASDTNAKRQMMMLKTLEDASYQLCQLNEDEIEAVMRRTNQYLIDGEVEIFVRPLMAILDTRDRQKLLTYIRPLVQHKHLSTFDRMIQSSESPLESPSTNDHNSTSRRFGSDKNFVLKKDSKRNQRSSDSLHDNYRQQVTLPIASLIQHGDEMATSGGTDGLKMYSRGGSSASKASDPQPFTARHRESQMRAEKSSRVDIPSSQSLISSSTQHRHGTQRTREASSSSEVENIRVDEIQPPHYFRDDSNKLQRPKQRLSDADEHHSVSENYEGRRGIYLSGSDLQHFPGRRSKADLPRSIQKNYEGLPLETVSDPQELTTQQSKTALFDSTGYNQRDFKEQQSKYGVFESNESDQRLKAKALGQQVFREQQRVSDLKKDGNKRQEVEEYPHEEMHFDFRRQYSKQQLEDPQMQSRKGIGEESEADVENERNNSKNSSQHSNRKDQYDYKEESPRFGLFRTDAYLLRNRSQRLTQDNESGNSSQSERQRKKNKTGEPVSMEESDVMKQPHSWNWETRKTPSNSRFGTGDTAYHSESVPSVSSALQFLDKVLSQEDTSVNDDLQSSIHEPLTSRHGNSLISTHSAASPNSDALSFDSNLTSRRGSYDVTVPSERNSLSKATKRHVESSVKSSLSRYGDSGHASDFRSSTPVLAGFSLHRDEQLIPQEDVSSVSLTSIRQLGDEYSNHMSLPKLSQQNLVASHQWPVDSRTDRPHNHLSNWGFKAATETSHRRPSDFVKDTSNLSVQKRSMEDHRRSSISQTESLSETITVYLDKSEETLGLSISGGSDSKSQPDIMIDSVIPGGAAALEGTLKAGMQILSVDDVSLRSVTHQEAIKIIRRAFKDRSMPVMRVRVTL